MTSPATSQPDLLELEIGAFMGPHIKRARIALFLIGALYVISTYLAYGDVVELRNSLKAYADAAATNARAAELRNLADVAYYLTIGIGAAGAATIVLALIAGTKTSFAMYAATAIFVALTGLQLYFTGIQVLFSWIWWLAAITIGMGVQATWKADKLRRERRPSEATLLAA